MLPRLQEGDAAAVARDEDTVAQLEGVVAEWAALLAQVLQREQAAHVPGTGAQHTPKCLRIPNHIYSWYSGVSVSAHVICTQHCLLLCDILA